MFDALRLKLGPDNLRALHVNLAQIAWEIYAQ